VKRSTILLAVFGYCSLFWVSFHYFVEYFKFAQYLPWS